MSKFRVEKKKAKRTLEQVEADCMAYFGQEGKPVDPQAAQELAIKLSKAKDRYGQYLPTRFNSFWQNLCREHGYAG